MKKNTKYLFGIILIFTIGLLLVSCATTEFDRSLLKSSGIILSPKLPNLEITSADSLSVGVSNQIESSSILYTIFRREVENNVCESNDLAVGSIELELIYCDVNQNHYTMTNSAVLELEVRILDSDKHKIWSNVYSGKFKKVDAGLGWTWDYVDGTSKNTLAILAHQLIEEMKLDIISNYDMISGALYN